MHGSFLKQRSSTSKQIWFQAAVDACATTWNWSQHSPRDGWFVPENVSPFLCTHVVYTFAKLRGNNLEAFEWNDESTDWSCKFVIRNCCHCCFVPQLNTVGVIRYIICSCMWTCMMLSIGWEGCSVWNHAIYCSCWCGYALWQMHTVGWEDCVCPFLNFYYLFSILPLVHTHRLRRIVTISVRWMLLCKEVIIAEDSPYVTMQHMTF